MKSNHHKLGTDSIYNGVLPDYEKGGIVICNIMKGLWGQYVSGGKPDRER